MNRCSPLRGFLSAVSAFIVAVGLIALTGPTANAAGSSSSDRAAARQQSGSAHNRRCQPDSRHCGKRSGSLFDDFDYASSSDPALARHGWAVRTAAGGPGVSGAQWTADNVSFPRVNGHKSLQLQMTTDGTAAGTTESEFTQSTDTAREGTYLARIKFSDAPVSGPDGDYLNETFFAIGAQASDCDPNYSETDFSEYLPNGGWGVTTHLNSETTWYTPGEDCSDSVENDQDVSLNGWHTIMATISDGHVRYYVDGHLVADHSGKYYPREDMAIDFNMWLIDLTGHRGDKTSVWHEAVDYVYYAQNQVLTQSQALHRVRSFRQRHFHYLDSTMG